MLSAADARSIAERHLRREFEERFGDNIVIIDEFVEEKPRGWIFPYQHRKYLKTRRARDGLIGGGPILVDRLTGKVVQFGSFGTNEFWYELYENGLTREGKDGIVHLLFRDAVKGHQRDSQK